MHPLLATLSVLAASTPTKWGALGAGLGIGRLGSGASESIARQPEASGDIRGISIITAAFIEGVALFAIVVCLIASSH